MNHIPFNTRRILVRAWGMLVVLVLGALWTAAPSLAEDAAPYGRTAVRPHTRPYTVQPGDTLYRLSQRFGTTVEELVALNDIRDPDLILVGQVLLVPGGPEPGVAPASTGSEPASTGVAPAGGPLSFTWERIGWRTERYDYISTLRITAQGGQPPYTYYHDGLLQEGPTFEVAWRRGTAKPGSVGVADASYGRTAVRPTVKEDYWLEDTCDYPAGVEITQPSEGEEFKKTPRHFNCKWVHTIDPPPDAYWIEIEAWQDGDWQPWQLYRHTRGESELFYVPDAFPGDLGGRLRMWGIYGSCEAREKTPWRYFEFRVTY